MVDTFTYNNHQQCHFIKCILNFNFHLVGIIRRVTQVIRCTPTM